LNALEVYILISLVFVMATMVELAIILLVKRKSEWANGIAHNANQKKNLKRVSDKQKQQADNSPKPVSGTEEEHLVFRTIASEHTTVASYGLITTTEMIDLAALFLFLASYATFNCIYWTQQ